MGITIEKNNKEVMKKINSWKFISSQGAKVKKRWISEGKKNNLSQLKINNQFTFFLYSVKTKKNKN